VLLNSNNVYPTRGILSNIIIFLKGIKKITII